MADPDISIIGITAGIVIGKVASFSADVDFDRNRSKADIDQAAPIKLDL